MGIDFGTRRIGISLCDVSRTLASPLTTLVRRAGKRPPFRRLVELIEMNHVELVVVGLPLQLDGGESDWTTTVREFGEKLSKRSGRVVHFYDERFSSVGAENRLRALGLPKSKREDKARVDAAAAALILQGWLDCGGC